jgi:pilus assembly protein CpaE
MRSVFIWESSIEEGGHLMQRAIAASNVIDFPEALQPVSRRRRPRVIVVDDSPNYQEIVCTLIEMDDVVDIVGRASNGADAIQTVAHLRPDLLVMDVEMPLVDGLAAAQFLSRHFPITVIMLMSADNSQLRRAACLESGARAFIYKPNFREEFLRALERAFDITSVTTLPAG